MKLTSTSDILQLVTDAAATTDVQVTWDDTAANNSVPQVGRQNTAITTAATTSILTFPSASLQAGFYRSVCTLSVRNKHASLAVNITVKHTDGTTAVELFKANLAAGDGLFWDADSGWTVRNAAGAVKAASATGASSVAVLAADVVNADASANTMADVTGLSFPVLTGKTYYFKFTVLFITAADTTGCRWAVNGPAATYLSYTSEYTLTVTTSTRNPEVTAYDSPAGASATAVAAQSHAVVEGFVRPSADGTLALRFASEVSASAVTAKAGSQVEYRQLT